MNPIIAVLAILGVAFLIQLAAKLILLLFFPEKKKTDNNPYIIYHKTKMQNDKNYEEYLDWLEKHGDGVPVDKVLTPEDKKASKKIKKLL